MSDPPSLIVDTASPRSTDTPNLVFDSSRYSGLLSVLEDVIGPAQSIPDEQVTDTQLCCPDDLFSGAPMASGDSTLVTESDSTLVSQDSGSVSSMTFDASFPPDGDETTNALSVDSIYPALFPNGETLGHEDPPTFAEADSEVAMGNSLYVVDIPSFGEEPPILPAAETEEPVGLAYDADYPVDEFATVPNQRHSSVASATSRFSGVSLLASPRNNRREWPSISPSNGPAQACTPDLLSPVQLSAKLRPFSLHSMGSPPLERGDSIDSGYADGDSWTGPLPLSRSPPLRDRSPDGAGLPRVSQSSFTLPAIQESTVSFDVEAVHRSPLMETVEESIDEDIEECEDATSLILDAYDNSASDEEDDYSSPTMRISESFDHADVAEQNPLPSHSSSIPSISCHVVFERPKSVEWIHTEQVGQLPPATDHDVTSKATLITQPSFDFSDTSSRVSSRRHDSLLSSHSGDSTPNTSTYSRDSDIWQGGEVCVPSICPSRGIHTLRSDGSSWPEIEQQATDEDMQSLCSSDGGNVELDSQSFFQPIEGEDLNTLSNTSTSYTGFTEVVETHGGLVEVAQDLEAGDNPVSQEYLGADHQSFSVDGVLQFPLPPTLEPVGHSTLTEDAVTLQSADVDNEADEQFRTRRPRAASDLTVKADSNNPCYPTTPPSTLFTDVDLQRSRAESDLTVKGGRASCSSHAVEQPPGIGQAETWRSSELSDAPYDERPNDVLHQHHASSSSTSGDDSTSPLQCTEPAVHSSAGQASPSSRSHTSPHSPTLSPVISPLYPQSHIVHSASTLRPLLTGRKSLLEASLFGDRAARSERNRSKSPSAPPTSSRSPKKSRNTIVPFRPGQRNHFPPRLITAPNDDSSTLPPRCSSADLDACKESPLSPSSSHSAPPSSGLKPLRLFSFHNTRRLSSLASSSSRIASDIVSPAHNIFNASTVPSPSVSSSTSFDRNAPLSSICNPLISDTLTSSDPNSPASPDVHHTHLSSNFLSLRRNSRSPSAPVQPSSWRLSNYRAGSRNYTTTDRRLSRRNSILSCSYVPCEEEGSDQRPTTDSDSIHRPASAVESAVHAIATPKPTLLFAIASDDVEQVRKVLESGEAGPNDPVGPQSALAFTLTNDKLIHKNEIVKALLAYGADPSALRDPVLNPAAHVEDGQPGPPPETTLQGMDPATRYFVSRADTSHTRQTSRLIYRSFFRPLTRVRYDVVGQDWALEQLFKVLSMHSQRLAVAPIVVLLCGPSGHGKSLLARKFGSLLEVPTHTVNMTTLRSTHDIWQSYSMSPYEDPSSCTLAEFLLENEGKRCVVVLDEIEKTEEQKALWSLLMPWELGRCTLEAGKRHVDVRNVIWLGTSNIGHELVFDHHRNRPEPDKQMTREEYFQLMEMLRPRVSDCLGASLLSRVTTVLPFTPFTLEEKKAIAAEAVYSLGGDASRALSPQEVEVVVTQALPNYIDRKSVV